MKSQHIPCLAPRSRVRSRTEFARTAAGFTLIELMITVAIVAILAAIAYPSYRNYVLRGQLVAASNGLSALQANMERFYQDNRTYATVGVFTSPCTAYSVGNFAYSCNPTPTSTATAYTIQAVGSGPTAGFTYTLTSLGVQATTVTGVRGWAGCTTAWVLKQSDAC